MATETFMGGELPEIDAAAAAEVQAEFREALAAAQAEMAAQAASAPEEAQVRRAPIVVNLSEEALDAIEGALLVEPEAWHLRATACELLALSLRYPTPDLIEIVAHQDWVGAAREIAEAMEMELPAGWGDDLGDVELHAFRAEATRLMVGAPTPVCSPYEGIWRAEDDGVQPLLFVNPHSMDVERFCKRCGLGQPKGTNEPLDHVATELELLQYLASIAAGIALPFEEGPALETFPGGGAAQAYAAFMTDHVMTWMPRFAARLAEESRIPYYKAVGKYLAAFLEL